VPAGTAPVGDDARARPYDDDLANRIRELTADEPDVIERIDPEETTALLAEPHGRVIETRGRAIVMASRRRRRRPHPAPAPTSGAARRRRARSL
jgi:hypothetical protein